MRFVHRGSKGNAFEVDYQISTEKLNEFVFFHVHFLEFISPMNTLYFNFINCGNLTIH